MHPSTDLTSVPSPVAKRTFETNAATFLQVKHITAFVDSETSMLFHLRTGSSEAHEHNMEYATPHSKLTIHSHGSQGCAPTCPVGGAKVKSKSEMARRTFVNRGLGFPHEGGVAQTRTTFDHFWPLLPHLTQNWCSARAH